MSMSTSNYVTRVAIVGASGNVGKWITEALLKTGKHQVTAITRAESQSKLPEGVTVKKVDYTRPETLVEALQGQDALIITVSTRNTIDGQQEKLIEAAAAAGVEWILPNDWSPDTAHEGLCKDVFIFAHDAETRKHISRLGKSSYISVVTGFWYEWSLAINDAWGFDFKNRTVTLFDDGAVKISTSTWPQVGRAVASLLSLPIKVAGSDESRSLEHFRNKLCYVKSFTVSQQDMLASVLRVTNTTLEDWKINKESATDRYAAGKQAMQTGDRIGFVRMMYARVFFADGAGDFERYRGTANLILGLPEEEIDEATKVAIARSEQQPWRA